MTLPTQKRPRRPLEGGTLMPDYLGDSNLLSRTRRLERAVGGMSVNMLSSAAAAGAYVRRRGSLFMAGWGQASVANGQSDVTLNRFGASLHAPLILPFSGSIVSVMVSLTAARTAGTLTVKVFVSGSASGLEAVIDGDNPLTVDEVAAPGEYPFDSGEPVTICISTSSWSPTSADVLVAIEISAT